MNIFNLLSVVVTEVFGMMEEPTSSYKEITIYGMTVSKLDVPEELDEIEGKA